MVTSATEEGQAELLMLHSKIFGPTASAVRPVVAEVADVIDPPPAIKLHKPVPTVGVFPKIVAVGEVIQTDWLALATAVVGN